MGGVFSSSKAFREALEVSTLGTPTKRQQRLLEPELDPRSPTTEVVRTPIVVESTPARRNPAHVASCETPTTHHLSAAPARLHLDPRSPSEEIVRTPLQLGEPGMRVADPRSPSVELCRTPIISKRDSSLPEEDATNAETEPGQERSDSVPNIDAIPPIPDLDLEDEIINRSLSEPDLTKDDIYLIRRRNVPMSNSFRESTPKKRSKVSHQGLSHEDLTAKSLRVKDRSPLTVRENQRSPLSVRTNIDLNSPRVIVQRKQMTKLVLSMKVPKIHKDSPKKCTPRSPSKYQSLEAEDKENIIEY